MLSRTLARFYLALWCGFISGKKKPRAVASSGFGGLQKKKNLRRSEGSIKIDVMSTMLRTYAQRGAFMPVKDTVDMRIRALEISLHVLELTDDKAAEALAYHVAFLSGVRGEYCESVDDTKAAIDAGTMVFRRSRRTLVDLGVIVHRRGRVPRSKGPGGSVNFYNLNGNHLQVIERLSSLARGQR